MKTENRVNHDNSGAHALNSERARRAEPAAKQAEPSAAVEPAMTPPQESPALPRDEFHGMGGQYLIVDGKRVRVEPEKS